MRSRSCQITDTFGDVTRAHRVYHHEIAIQTGHRTPNYHLAAQARKFGQWLIKAADEIDAEKGKV